MRTQDANRRVPIQGLPWGLWATPGFWLIIAAPVVEELFFRGFLFSGLQRFRLRTGSIYTSITLHMRLNLIATIQTACYVAAVDIA